MPIRTALECTNKLKERLVNDAEVSKNYVFIMKMKIELTMN